MDWKEGSLKRKKKQFGGLMVSYSGISTVRYDLERGLLKLQPPREGPLPPHWALVAATRGLPPPEPPPEVGERLGLHPLPFRPDDPNQRMLDVGITGIVPDPDGDGVLYTIIDLGPTDPRKKSI